VNTTTSIVVTFGKTTAKNWSSNPEINWLFLRTTQNYMNDLLMSRGHVFLNEVYDQLGMRRTSKGATDGWLRSRGNTVQFWNENLESDEEGTIRLEFETDGVIYDKIENES
jgi:hypothetical protein